MADPLSTITSIIQLLQISKAAYDSVQDATHLPQAFDAINARIELATATLEEIRLKYQKNTEEEAKIRRTLQECEKDAEDLKAMYETVCAAAGGNWQHRYRSIFSNMVHDRKCKVEGVWRRLLEGLEVLRGYHLFKTLSTAEEIAAAIVEIQNVEDSLPDDGATFYAPVGLAHTGSGANSANVWQNNIHAPSNLYQGGTHHHQAPEAPHDSTPMHIIPFPRDEDFIEYGGLLDRINSKLARPTATVALVGLGGVGKSQLAIEHCYRVKERSPETWVLWVHASSLARYAQGIRKIADIVQIRGRDDVQADIFQLVDVWLRQGKKNWILGLDNVDDASFLAERRAAREDRGGVKSLPSLFELLPVCDHGSIFITSRTERAALTLVERSDMIAVKPMDEGTAMRLLAKRLGKQHAQDAGVELVKTLEYMPLAITQAAAYINQRGRRWSVERYLKEVQEYLKKAQSGAQSKRGILEIGEVDLRRDKEGEDAIMLTWCISFEHVRQVRPSAADLLALMSFCDRQSIPEDLVRRRGAEKYGSGRRENDGDVGEEERDDEDDASLNSSETNSDDGFDDDLVILESYSFVSVTTTAAVFEMHRLVQLATRRWLESQNEQERWKERYIENLRAAFTETPSQGSVTSRVMFPHVKLALDLKPKLGSDALLTWARLMYIAAGYAVVGGYGYEHDAEKMAEECLKALEMELKDNDPKILLAMVMVARVRNRTGRCMEAEALLMRVLEAHEKALRADDPPDELSIESKHTIMLDLASSCRDQRKWEQAEKLILQVLEGERTVYGEEHIRTLDAMHNLAVTYLWQRRWADAESLLVPVLERKKKALGEEHLDTLIAMGNLATSYRNQGKLTEAEELHKRGVAVERRVLGEQHPTTLISMSSLAEVYRQQRRLAEAEVLLTRVVAIRRAALGEGHRDNLVDMSNLAGVIARQGRLAEAEELETEALKRRVKVLGDHHPDTLTNKSNLAWLFGEQGRLAQAVQLETEVLEASKTVQGAEHPYTLLVMHSLAQSLRKSGRNEAACALLSDCASLSARILGADHPHTLVRNGALQRWTQR
ncbi:hypothetical protein BDY17DRAFT_322901 [Neohortaea acidophila]|uniref:NACHT-NTPase and P-loop NTPases N-terminal domain-containing protein n=1 Tax=Neohortaea acidophila TaxID=245834 RepID=A0A6A6PV61_9PEZI|nr:uncharacterized protein BDY17DRAFT_322901 [Neohortaea acidophila]KAF2484018.1 hypothetical protein BDY17DRAFT_322901 [Neohortaea acidophila]